MTTTDPIPAKTPDRPGETGSRTLGATLATMSSISIAWTVSAVAFLAAVVVAIVMFAGTARDVEYAVKDLTLWSELRVALEHFAFDAREKPKPGSDAVFLHARTDMLAALARVEALQADPDFEEDDAAEEHRHVTELRRDLEQTSERLLALRAKWRDATGDEAAKLIDEIDVLCEHELEESITKRIQGFVAAEERDASTELSRFSSYIEWVGGSLVVVVLMTLGATLVVLRRTANRLAAGASGLVAATMRVGAGQHGISVAPAGIREFDEVAVAFNTMSVQLKQAQEARVRAEKLAAIGQLAAGVGHELRNPLGAIRNAIFLVRKRLERTELATDAGLQKAIAAVESEGRACNKIVTDLLDFAREKSLQLSACPLRPLVDASVELVTRPERVAIVNAVPEDLPVPDLDRDQFRQVLINLIQNASDAVPEERAGTVRVEASAFESSIVLCISDDGSGIPEEALRTIFEPLYTTKKKGTGLGLAIVSTIVTRHRGTIEVESRPGEGATFSIRIPRSQPPSIEPPQETG
jgi:signal transduction histidine kinase